MNEKKELGDIKNKKFLQTIQKGLLISLYFVASATEILLLITMYYNYFFAMLLSIIVILNFLDFLFILNSKSKKNPIIIFTILCVIGCWIDLVVCIIITICPLIIIVIFKLILDKISR